jgi:hypothetical protein
MKRKCYKCHEEKELSEFFRQNRICNECKIEMHKCEPRLQPIVIKKVGRKATKMDVKSKDRRVINKNKKTEKYESVRRTNNVRIKLDAEDKYGRTKKDVRPGWDKILLGIKQKIANG